MCYRDLSINACCAGASRRDNFRDDFVAAWPGAILAQGRFARGLTEGNRAVQLCASSPSALARSSGRSPLN
eukprot:8098859-Alexandrium_andersonii.AAC.1